MKKIFTLRNTLLMAMLIAISIILSRFLGFYLDPNSLRISFEVAPIMLAGIWLGPFAGLMVGLIADSLGAIISGVAFNPLLSIGPALIGLLTGILFKYVFKSKRHPLIIGTCCVTCEFIGAMLVTTYILFRLFSDGDTFMAYFLSRLPFKLITIAGDTFIVYTLDKLLYSKVVYPFIMKGRKI